MFIDNEHLAFGNSAAGAKEERKRGNSEKKKMQIQIQEIFFILGYGRNVTFVRICYNFS